MAHLGHKQGQPFVEHFAVVVALAGGRAEEPFQHHLQRVLDAGDAAGGVEITLLFLGKGMGRVVGGDGVDDAVDESAPQPHAVVVALDGGVAFYLVAQLGIVAVVEPQVVGGHLGGDVLVVDAFVAEEGELGGGADVGDMEAGVVLAGAFDGFVGGDETGFAVADFGMQGGVLAFLPGKLHLVVSQVGLDDALFLAVGYDELAALGEELVEDIGFVDQHVAGAAAQEELDGGVAQRVDGQQVVDVVVGGSEHESVVDGTLLGGQRLFVFEVGKGGGLRVSVGHVDDGGDTPGQGGIALGGEVGLGGEARVAEVDMGVDDAGYDIAPFGRKGLGVTQCRGTLDNPSVVDEEVARGDGALVDDGAVLDDVVH